MSMINQSSTIKTETVKDSTVEGIKKRILIFSTAYLPLVGGAEVAIKEITDRLSCYDFDLITARLDKNLPKKEAIGRVTVYRVGFGLGVDKIILMFWGHRLACKLHRKNKYDAIWAVMASFGGLAAVKFKKRHRAIPFLLTLQEGDDLEHIENKAKILGYRWRDIFKQADFVQCISTYLAVWARKMGASEIKVVPNGVDVGLFSKLNLKKNNNFNLVTTSRLVHKNGLDLVIKALPLLPKPVELHIAGTGPSEAGLKQLAHKLGVAKRVFFHGFIPYEKLPQFLAQGRIFIRPSRSEGLGNSFLEAMACGLPIIGTRVGGIADFLTDNVTGFVVKDEDPEDIARVVNNILDSVSDEQLASITSQAKKLIVEKYTWNTVSTNMDQIFKTLL